MARTSKLSTIPLETAQQRLAMIWLGAGGLLIVFLVVQSIGGQYSPEQLPEVWGWVLPLLLPTISLILSVLGASALEARAAKPATDFKVRRNFYQVAMWLSLFYLALVILPILAASLPENANLDLLKRANLWLAPIQGLVVAALGVLFFTKEGSGEA